VSTFSVVSQRGVGAAQSASLAQPAAAAQWPRPPETPAHVSFAAQPLRPRPQPGTQKPFAPVQTRPESAAPQAMSVAQPHRPVATRHCGSAPSQPAALVAEHSVQAPASGPVFWHAGRAGSGQLGAPSAVHGAQVCVTAEQTGAVPPQSALPRQATQTPPPPVVSQSGVAAGQRLVSAVVHCAQAPVARHTGNCGSQSALVRHTRHVWAVGSQIGRVPEQSLFARHSTQVLDVGSQTSWAAAQALALPAPHTTQAPVAAQTGAVGPHSASAPQARHACVVPSHTGVPPPQSADVTQETHTPSVVSQSAVAPAQVAAFVAEHAPHAPEG
jgi:hypothetical protein